MKKSTLLNIVLACVLIGSILLVNAAHIPIDIITGPDEIPPIKEYDPFADVNGNESMGYPDGKIDIRDIGYVASKFGTQGDSARNVTISNLENITCGDCQPPGTYKDVVEITALKWTSAIGDTAEDLGIRMYSPPTLLPFDFSPKGSQPNVTDIWIIITKKTLANCNTRYDITINENITITTPDYNSPGYPTAPLTETIHIEDENVYQLIQLGINTLKFHNVQSTTDRLIYIYRVTVLIEYEYKVD